MSVDEFAKSLRSGYTSLSEHPDVKACVKAIADIVSITALHLLESTDFGNKRVSNGLHRRIDIEPNRYVARTAMYYKIAEELLLYGNSFLLPIYSKKGYLEELRPIRHNKVVYIDTNDGGYKLSVNNNLIDSDNVLHFVNNPKHSKPWQGESYKVYLRDVLENLTQSQEIKHRYYKEHFRPSLVFLANADSDSFNDEDDRENLLKRWVNVKPGSPYILPGSLIDFKTYSPMSLTDIAVNESVEIDKKYLASLFCIPPFLLGVGSFNREEYNLFIDRAVKRICNIISQELTRKIIISENMFFRFHTESQKVVNPYHKLQLMYSGKTMGIYSANECRIAAGDEAVSKQEMNEYTILENYINVEDSNKQKKLIQEEGDE